jgi:hypothetical protein
VHLAFISRAFWATLMFAMAASAQIYSQQGGKLVGAGAIYKQVPTNAIGVSQGWAVALSSDGNTALAGAPADNGGVGAAWVFVRQNGVTWSQQGNKLVPSDASSFTSFGQSVALSADGSTAITGGPTDNSSIGAAWTSRERATALGRSGAASWWEPFRRTPRAQTRRARVSRSQRMATQHSWAVQAKTVVRRGCSRERATEVGRSKEVSW